MVKKKTSTKDLEKKIDQMSASMRGISVATWLKDKDKILNRFRKYFGGKKAMKNRQKKLKK